MQRGQAALPVRFAALTAQAGKFIMAISNLKGAEYMTIRLEEPRDYRAVEELTREAFWNKYRPGCWEHYVLHQFRGLPEFVQELDYVLEEQGQIAAHIMYARAELQQDSGGVLPILVFGPVSVRPELQGRGYGSRIIRYTMEQAASMGFGAIAITGDPGYYSRFGFVGGHSVGVYYDGIPRSEDAPFFMVKELTPGFLQGISAVYHDPAGYFVSEEAVEEFDRSFPPREKLVLPGQLS